jgi:hypothetical protein
MAIEGEVMTIHQKIAEAHKQHKEDFGMGGERQMKVFDAPKISEMQQCLQMLQYLLDKVHSMDKWMRLNLEPRTVRQYESDAQRAERNAEAMGLANIKQLNEIAQKEIAKNVNDSKEANRTTGTDTKQVSGSGSGINRQGDFRAGNSGNPEVGQKSNDNIGKEKVNDK